MKTKAVILNLRVAIRSDFADSMGQKKFGCMYFQQSMNGTFCNQPYFFHENTDMKVFKELYSTNQIWVLAGIFDEVEIIDKRKPILKNEKIKKTSGSTIRNGLRFDRSNRPCTCKKSK